MCCRCSKEDAKESLEGDQMSPELYKMLRDTLLFPLESGAGARSCYSRDTDNAAFDPVCGNSFPGLKSLPLQHSPFSLIPPIPSKHSLMLLTFKDFYTGRV